MVPVDTAVVVGALAACAVYLILQSGFVRMLFGFVLLSHAVNFLVISVSGDPSDKVAPLVDGTGKAMVDPLPQAFVLTAIVINFAVTAYLVLLLYRLFLEEETTTAHGISSKPNESSP